MHSAVDPRSLDQILSSKFGLEAFRPKQREVIDRILSGQHTLALLPTGYGKSLCYQLPSQLLPGATVVISPLIALMRDQVEGLRRRGIDNATCLNSSLALDEVWERVEGVKSGRYKLLYVAPERFESPRFRELLASLNVSLLVIDEAHCISQWGHDFRPQYRNLSSHLVHLPETVILALTATATPAVQKDIIHCLGLPRMESVVASFNRSNLFFDVYPASQAIDKEARLLDLVSGKSLPCIVYAATRKECERLSSLLKWNKVRAAHYHGGMAPSDRDRIQRQFENEELPVLACTIAFGMGIDKANVRQVIHYNLPASLENYYQEAGRAGRDGEKAVCTLLFHGIDSRTQTFFLERNYPDYQQVLTIYDAIRRRELEPVRVTTIAQETGIFEGAVNNALDLLKQLQLIDVSRDGLYTDKGTGGTINMHLLQERQRRDEDRLGRMIRYAREAKCRRVQILEYFGQSLEGYCAGCDVCHGRKLHGPGLVPAQSVSLPHSADEIAAVMELVGLLNGKIGRKLLAGILSGSRSEKLLGRGLDRFKLYGALKRLKQDSIVALIDALMAKGLLSQEGDLYPVIVLTAEGKALLRNGNYQSLVAPPSSRADTIRPYRATGENLSSVSPQSSPVDASRPYKASGNNPTSVPTQSSSADGMPPSTHSRHDSIAAQASAGRLAGDEKLMVHRFVRELNGRYGKTLIAQALIGAKNKRTMDAGLEQVPGFSSLSHLSYEKTLVLIDELIAQGTLEVYGSLYPKIRLTEKGTRTLSAWL